MITSTNHQEEEEARAKMNQLTFTAPRGTYCNGLLTLTSQIEETPSWEPSKLKEMQYFGPIAMLDLLKKNDFQTMAVFCNKDSGKSNNLLLDERGARLLKVVTTPQLTDSIGYATAYGEKVDHGYWLELLNMESKEFKRRTSAFSEKHFNEHCDFYDSVLGLVSVFVTGAGISETTMKTKLPKYAEAQEAIKGGTEKL